MVGSSCKRFFSYIKLNKWQYAYGNLLVFMYYHRQPEGNCNGNLKTCETSKWNPKTIQYFSETNL